MENKLAILGEEGSQPENINAIVDEVFGTTSRYNKGLGYGPKPIEKVSNVSFAKLKETLTKTQNELQQYKSNYEVIRNQMQL